MKVSLEPSHLHSDWQLIRDVWVAADDVEVFFGRWTFDHFDPLRGDEAGPCLEGGSSSGCR